MTLVEIAVITFLLAILCQLAVIGACCSKRGLDWVLARLVEVEVLKTVGTAMKTARNGFLIVAILIVMISAILLSSKWKKLVLWVLSRTENWKSRHKNVDWSFYQSIRWKNKLKSRFRRWSDNKGDEEITVEIERLAKTWRHGRHQTMWIHRLEQVSVICGDKAIGLLIMDESHLRTRKRRKRQDFHA